MSDTNGGGDAGGNRSKEIWIEDDYRRLASGIRDGLELDGLAELLGRTAGAITSRARYMIDPQDEREPGERPIDVLRRVLSDDHDYDWETHVRRVSAEKGWHYWTSSELDSLQRHWEGRTPLVELAASFELTETQLVEFLIRRRIADTTIEVVERLGCARGGHIETRYRLAKDRAMAEVWVLVMAGLPLKQPTHVSLHGTEEAAEAQREELLESGPSNAGKEDVVSASVWWCISKRVPGHVDGALLREGTHNPL